MLRNLNTAFLGATLAQAEALLQDQRPPIHIILVDTFIVSHFLLKLFGKIFC